MFSEELTALATLVIADATTAGWRLAVAESCTGGLVTGCLTGIPGASAVLDRGFVTYSNQAKVELLGVDPALIARFGAVSAETAAAMASGALVHAAADCALAITGIAGPGGATPDKPVGLVWFGLACRNQGTILSESQHFPGDRNAVRLAAVRQGLILLARGLGNRG